MMKGKKVGAVSGFISTVEQKGKTLHVETKNVMGALQKNSKNKNDSYVLVSGGGSGKGHINQDGKEVLDSVKMSKPVEKTDMSLEDVMKAMKKLMNVHTKQSKSRHRSGSRGRGMKSKSK
jgi:type II secretory pathway predicted ATPase ExeA